MAVLFSKKLNNITVKNTKPRKKEIYLCTHALVKSNPIRLFIKVQIGEN